MSYVTKLVIEPIRVVCPMSKLPGLWVTIFLFGCGYKAQAQPVPTHTPKFGYNCRASRFFAELFGSLCDPYLFRVNCVVGMWSRWSSVTELGGEQCGQSRTRKIQQLPRNGGVPCPVLTEDRAVTCKQYISREAICVIGTAVQ
jgi:hypothetical protein